MINRCGGLMAVLSALAAILLASGNSAPANAEEPARDYLYKISTLRAAPARLRDLMDLLLRKEEVGYYALTRDEPPMLMRHSQGDQWDLMLIHPIGSYEDYYDDDRIERREDNAEFARTFDEAMQAMVSFREDLFAYGPGLETVRPAYDGAGFFHIEMFHAAAGQHANLVREREMENDYLVRTDRRPNLIFVGDQGSDVDSLTIGFYASLQDYAEPTGLSAEQTDAAAKAAGFPDGNSIGTYLRRFLIGHHDTLAVRVQ